MSDAIRKMLEKTPPLLLDEIRSEAPAMVAFVTSKGFELWMKWVSATEEGLKDNAALGATLEEREEAHYDLVALRKLKTIPFFLTDLAKAIDSPDGSVSDPAGVDEAL